MRPTVEHAIPSLRACTAPGQTACRDSGVRDRTALGSEGAPCHDPRGRCGREVQRRSARSRWRAVEACGSRVRGRRGASGRGRRSSPTGPCHFGGVDRTDCPLSPTIRGRASCSWPAWSAARAAWRPPAVFGQLSSRGVPARGLDLCLAVDGARAALDLRHRRPRRLLRPGREPLDRAQADPAGPAGRPVHAGVHRRVRLLARDDLRCRSERGNVVADPDPAGGARLGLPARRPGEPRRRNPMIGRTSKVMKRRVLIVDDKLAHSDSAGGRAVRELVEELGQPRHRGGRGRHVRGRRGRRRLGRDHRLHLRRLEPRTRTTRSRTRRRSPCCARSGAATRRSRSS